MTHCRISLKGNTDMAKCSDCEERCTVPMHCTVKRADEVKIRFGIIIYEDMWKGGLLEQWATGSLEVIYFVLQKVQWRIHKS